MTSNLGKHYSDGNNEDGGDNECHVSDFDCENDVNCSEDEDFLKEVGTKELKKMMSTMMKDLSKLKMESAEYERRKVGKRCPFYAVAKGRTRGVFTVWEDVAVSIHEFVGARWGGYRTRPEAVAFLNSLGMQGDGTDYVERESSLMGLKNSGLTSEFQKVIGTLMVPHRLSYYATSGVTIRTWLEDLKSTCSRFIIDQTVYAPVIGHCVKAFLPKSVIMMRWSRCLSNRQVWKYF